MHGLFRRLRVPGASAFARAYLLLAAAQIQSG